MEKIWIPRYVVDVSVSEPTQAPTVAFPQLRDLATREDAGFFDVWLAAKDGTLWRHGPGPFPPRLAGQEPCPGNVTGLTMDLSDELWAVIDQRELWLRKKSGQWTRIPVPNGIEPLVDVTVHHSTAWILRDDGATWRTADGVTFQETTSLIPLKRLAGRNEGELWGISLHPTANLFHQTEDGVWRTVEGGHDKSWADISVTTEGTVWLVATDGTVWSTSDEGLTYLKAPGDGFTRISGADPWAVKADGTLWILQPKPSTPLPPAPAAPPAPTPQPPVPPMTEARPQISVSATGSGGSSVFHVTGTGFLSGTEVTIRVAWLEGESPQNRYRTTPSSAQGTISEDLPFPCVPGLEVSFSANDGRRDPHNFTDRFWSNTVTRACP